jgi:hypothetical protein
LNETNENKIIVDDNIEKPILPKNFSICRINNVDYLQFHKKEDGKKYQLQRKINSYNIQEIFNNFVKEVNDNFDLNLESFKIDNSIGWKTINKIIDKEKKIKTMEI